MGINVIPDPYIVGPVAGAIAILGWLHKKGIITIPLVREVSNNGNGKLLGRKEYDLRHEAVLKTQEEMKADCKEKHKKIDEKLDVLVSQQNTQNLITTQHTELLTKGDERFDKIQEFMNTLNINLALLTQEVKRVNGK